MNLRFPAVGGLNLEVEVALEVEVYLDTYLNFKSRQKWFKIEIEVEIEFYLGT